MPTFEYLCPGCRQVFEMVGVTSTSMVLCLHCKHPCLGMDRLPAAPSFVLKGAGFYCNDSREKK